jgi:hypothetical protein
MSKFKSIKERLAEVTEKVKKIEDAKANPSFDKKTWQFNPILPKNKARVDYVVRILPNVHVNDGLDEPWLLTYAHMWDSAGGKKVYAPCPTTNGKDEKCPICAKSKPYWALVNAGEGTQADEVMANTYNRKKRYYVSVYVVSDARAGTEEDQTGKVLLWEFGPQIYEKLYDAFLEKIPFYDPFEGFNFNLIIKRKDEYPSYESSKFSAAPSAIAKSEEELEKIHSQIFDLAAKFKERSRSYDELKKVLQDSLSLSERDKTETTTDSEAEGSTTVENTESEPVAEKKVVAPEKKAPAPEKKAVATGKKVAPAKAEVEGDSELPDESAGEGDIDLDSLSTEELFK